MTTSDNTQPFRYNKSWQSSEEYPNRYDQFNIGVAEFSRLYTTGEMTLCQAVNGLISYVTHTGSYDQIKWSAALAFVGHRLTFQDEVAVEVGYDGDIDAWLAAGNLPQGWYSLFKDNYPGYSREMKRTYERNGEDAGSDSGSVQTNG